MEQILLEGAPPRLWVRADSRIFQLPFTGAPMKLEIHFIQHPQSGSTDGMAETFEPSIYLTGNTAPIQIIKPIHDVFNRTPPR